MQLAGHTTESLAEATGFHPKQVGRWVADGAVPRRKGAKAQVAELLRVDEDDIWPRVPGQHDQVVPVTGEVVEVWAHRADMPTHRWWDLLADARSRIDLLDWTLAFLREDHPHLDRLLGAKLAAGCRVRVVLADPMSRQVQDRDEEELLHGQLAKRVRHSLATLRTQPDLQGLELRTHNRRYPLYASLCRADDQIFSTPHLFGVPGWAAPLYVVRRRGADGLFDTLMTHFEGIWEAAEPVDRSWPGLVRQTG
jgi:hypothetical protein